MKLQTRLKAGTQGASSFSRTMRSLEADGFRRSNWSILLVAVLLGAWLMWFFLARLSRYEVTDQARLEVDRAVYPVQAPASGRVVVTRLALGQQVQAGDVLVEVDTDPERLQLEEERARLASLSPEIAALRQETGAVEQARREERQASTVMREQAKAQFREGEALARFAEQEAERLRRLRSEGLIAAWNRSRRRARATARRGWTNSGARSPGWEGDSPPRRQRSSAFSMK
jgi:multidrug resistance efflux pump